MSLQEELSLTFEHPHTARSPSKRASHHLPLLHPLHRLCEQVPPRVKKQNKLYSASGRLGLSRLRLLDGGLVIDDLLRSLGREEHGAILRPVQQRDKERRSNHNETKSTETVGDTVLTLLVQEQVTNHSTKVSTSTDDTRHGTSNWRVNERHNTEGATLSHLHEQREANKRRDGGTDDTDAREDHKHDTLGQLHTEESPQTSAHAELGSEAIGKEASKGTSENVHQTEQTSNQTSDTLVEHEGFRVVLEIGSKVAIHHKLNTETSGVQEEQNPHPPVEDSSLHSDEGVGLLLATGLLELAVVALRKIIREEEHGNGSEDESESGHNDGKAPALVLITTSGSSHTLLDERHESVGDTSTEVTPSGGSGVGSTDNVAREHDRGPELGDNKRGTDETDEETGSGPLPVLLGSGHQQKRDREDRQQKTLSETRTETITERTNSQTHKDGTQHGNNVLGLEAVCKAVNEIVVTNVGLKRSESEPSEESKEEREPSEVEGTHVRALEAEDTKSGSLSLLIDGKREGVLLLRGGGHLRRRSGGFGSRHCDCGSFKRGGRESEGRKGEVDGGADELSTEPSRGGLSSTAGGGGLRVGGGVGCVSPARGALRALRERSASATASGNGRGGRRCAGEHAAKRGPVGVRVAGTCAWHGSPNWADTPALATVRNVRYGVAALFRGGAARPWVDEEAIEVAQVLALARWRGALAAWAARRRAREGQDCSCIFAKGSVS
ncbi:Nitrate transporter [Gracilaria domingensis]|nr:Nitrate transporter [Gracilaria domingensis]